MVSQCLRPVCNHVGKRINSRPLFARTALAPIIPRRVRGPWERKCAGSHCGSPCLDSSPCPRAARTLPVPTGSILVRLLISRLRRNEPIPILNLTWRPRLLAAVRSDIKSRRPKQLACKPNTLGPSATDHRRKVCFAWAVHDRPAPQRRSTTSARLADMALHRCIRPVMCRMARLRSHPPFTCRPK